MSRARAYVNRPSQITKRAPSKRLKRRRKKNTVAGRFPNPRPLMYIITAQSRGATKRMHYDGKHFSERAKIALFKSKDAAYQKALALVAAHPVLKRYRIAVADNRGFR